jgi:branched-chain amino acid transport system ATP-binding protein
MLEVRDGSAGYDSRRTVIHDVNLEIGDAEFVTLLGANGAGKSTLLRSVMGLCKWQGGKVLHDGADITRLTAHARVKRGLALVPQGHELFLDLTVKENIQLGCYGASRRHAVAAVEAAYDAFPLLRTRSAQRASTLSGGERALVAIARALASKPSLLLLDEPSLGLSPGARKAVFDYLKKQCAEQGLAVLLAEQDAKNALEAAAVCYGMRNGSATGWIAAGRVTSDQIRDLYLTGITGTWGSAVPRLAAEPART